jgi:hypothetical protein
MNVPARYLITPLSRESIARLVITPLRVSPAKITATRNATPFSAIARLVVSALTVLTVLTSQAQNVGDFILPEKTASTGRITNRYWPKGASTLWGTNSSSLPAKIVVGTGLSLSGSPLTLTATGGGSGGGTWGSITGTLSEQTDLATALGLKAPLASPTFTGTVAAPNYTLSASESDTLSGIQHGIGWRDDRFTLQGPEGALQMYETGDPLESVLYWAGRFMVGSLEAAEITGEISGALVTSGMIPASVMEASLTQPLRSFVDSSANAGTKGLTYANTGPNSQNEPTNPGTYYPQILVVDGDPDKNYLEGRIRSKAQFLADLDLEIGTDVQAYNANTSTLGSSIDLTSEVTGILPPANMGTGSSITTKYLRGDGTWQTISGGGDALTSGNLSQFASTTSAQLRGVLSDESGTGEFLTTNGSAASLTSFPTLNQSTSGNAATATALQTGRAINGVTFDGTAAITVTAAADTLTGTTLASNVDTSSLTTVGTIVTGVWHGTAIGDSYISSATTWNAKESALTFSTGLTRSTNTITVNTTQNIATLSNLTSNGFVKTSGGTGALSIDTATYLTTTGNGSSLTGITQSQVSGLTTTDRPQFANVRSTHSTLTYAATTDIDLDTDGFQTVTLTGNITFTTSNRAAGRSKTIRIVGDSSLRTFTFPGWTFVGAAAPASLAANKDAILTITAFGTADTDIVAAYAVEP